MAADDVISINDVPTILNVLYSRFANAIAPQPIELGTSGFTAPIPVDFYITRSRLRVLAQNQTAIPCQGTLWELVSRYDSDDDLHDIYLNALSQQGNMGTTVFPGSTPITDQVVDSTPFLYRALCQRFKVVKKTVFTLTPGTHKEFVFDQKRMFHVTSRISGLEIIRNYTRCFHFNFVGTPVNDSTTKANISTGYGDVNLSLTQSYEFEVRPQPYQFVANADNRTSPATPSLLVVNNPTAITSIPVA